DLRTPGRARRTGAEAEPCRSRPARRRRLRGGPAGRRRGVAGDLRLLPLRPARRGGDRGRPLGVPAGDGRPGGAAAAGAVVRRLRGDAPRRVVRRCSRPRGRARGDRTRGAGVAAAPRRAGLRPRRHRRGVPRGLPAVPRRVRRPAGARRGRHLAGGHLRPGHDRLRHRGVRRRRHARPAPDGPPDLPEEVLGGVRRVRRRLRSRRVGHGGAPARRPVVGRGAPRPARRRGGHARRPLRVGHQARPRHQGHVAGRPRSRRPHGPARLVAGDGRADLAAAVLPRRGVPDSRAV
ncbi:MAG: Phosphatidate cytidylyltransferase, partial [uncultured Nocardioidaceae bacterium]